MMNKFEEFLKENPSAFVATTGVAVVVCTFLYKYRSTSLRVSTPNCTIEQGERPTVSEIDSVTAKEDVTSAAFGPTASSKITNAKSQGAITSVSVADTASRENIDSASKFVNKKNK